MVLDPAAADARTVEPRLDRQRVALLELAGSPAVPAPGGSCTWNPTPCPSPWLNTHSEASGTDAAGWICDG